MPFYECPECLSVVKFEPALGRKSKICPFCGEGDIRGKNLDSVATEEINLAESESSKSKQPNKRQKTAQGRMQAAPTVTDWTKVTLNKDVSYVTNLTVNSWVNADTSKCIRLAYNLLNLKTVGMQGLIIALPALAGDPEAQKHFKTVTEKLVSELNSPSVTEATGEAAAAMAMLKHYPGFKMQWGMHCHSGAGIDQIWTSETKGKIVEVIIVEAKGPNAGLSDNRFMPPDFEQMERNWIIHNLATMISGAKNQVGDKAQHQGELANTIIQGLGITVGVTYPGYNGASKNYYGIATNTGTKTIKLRRLLVTARWQTDGLLAYDRTDLGELTDFKPGPPATKVITYP